ARREERPRAHLRERAPDVVLEDDEDEDERPAEEVPQEDVERVDLEHVRQEVDAVDHAEPDQHRHGARAADQIETPVDDDAQDEDVEAVLPAEAGEELLHARAMASATATTSRAAATSCTRSRRAPPATARARAAAVPSSRSPGGRPPSSWPMNPLRDAPTSTG